MKILLLDPDQIFRNELIDLLLKHVKATKVKIVELNTPEEGIVFLQNNPDLKLLISEFTFAGETHFPLVFSHLSPLIPTLLLSKKSKEGISSEWNMETFVKLNQQNAFLSKEMMKTDSDELVNTILSRLGLKTLPKKQSATETEKLADTNAKTAAGFKLKGHNNDAEDLEARKLIPTVGKFLCYLPTPQLRPIIELFTDAEMSIEMTMVPDFKTALDVAKVQAAAFKGMIIEDRGLPKEDIGDFYLALKNSNVPLPLLLLSRGSPLTNAKLGHFLEDQVLNFFVAIPFNHSSLIGAIAQMLNIETKITNAGYKRIPLALLEEARDVPLYCQSSEQEGGYRPYMLTALDGTRDKIRELRSQGTHFLFMKEKDYKEWVKTLTLLKNWF